VKLLTPEQVAEVLEVSRSTARRLLIEGVIPCVSIRSGKRKSVLRVREEILERWVMSRERESKKSRVLDSGKQPANLYGD
jgi:excisionase family DNA binding protein